MRARTATSRSATGRTSSRALLASAGVNERSGTAPPYRRDDARAASRCGSPWSPCWWRSAYGTRLSAGKPDPQVLYEWSTAVGGPDPGRDPARARARDRRLQHPTSSRSGRPRFWATARIARRPPSSRSTSSRSSTRQLVHVGNEQGLTPSHWEPHHAAAYVVNAIVICTWVPVRRGAHLSRPRLLAARAVRALAGDRLGRAPLRPRARPRRVAAGARRCSEASLAWIRARTDSVYPGMLLHALFNLIALVAAVTL